MHLQIVYVAIILPDECDRHRHIHSESGLQSHVICIGIGIKADPGIGK